MENLQSTYQLRFMQNSKMAMVLIFVPIIGIIVIITACLSIHIPMPEWAVLSLIMVMVLLLIAFTIFLTLKKTIVDCLITLTQEGFQYELLQHTFIYPRKFFFSTWDNISNISDNLDTQNNSVFYQATFISPKFTATFNVKKGYENDAKFFWIDLLNYKEAFNLHHQFDKQITAKGFYDSKAAWLLTQICYVMILAMLYVGFVHPDKISWWRIAGFMAFTVAWLINYHTNKKRKNKMLSK